MTTPKIICALRFDGTRVSLRRQRATLFGSGQEVAVA